MGFLIAALVIAAAVVIGGLWLARRDRMDRLRDQARLKVIEAQMAAMRAALRIQAAEHITRQRMQYYADDPLDHSTAYEEYRPS